MKENRYIEELDAKRFFLVKYGIVLLLIVGLLTLLGLALLSVDDTSILEMVIDYYFRNAHK